MLPIKEDGAWDRWSLLATSQATPYGGENYRRMETDPIQRERARLVTALRNIGPPHGEAVVAIRDVGFTGQRGWIAKRARVDVTLPPDPSGREVWRAVEIDLSTGPDDMYPYYPFATFVYVGGELTAVSEFVRAEERRTAHVRLPAGRTSELAFVTEVGGHSPNDARDLAVLLGQVRIGRVVAPPKPRSSPPAHESASQFLFPLDTETARPIFVVGAYRSGTSILTWAIGQHPNILPVEETRWLHLFGEGARAGFSLASRAARNFFQIYDISEREYLAHFGLSIDSLMRTSGLRLNHRTSLARHVNKLEQRDGTYDSKFQLARSAFNPKRRWVDGTPENSACIPVLRMLFPAARFLFAIRDPFDVIASMMQFDRAGGEPLAPEEAALMWTRLTSYGLLAYRAYGPEVVKIVRHADIVSNPVYCLRDVFDFLGEPRYERAGDTFGTRLNSSRIPPAERAVMLEKLRAELPGRAVVTGIYDQVMRCIHTPWVRDQDALDELDAGSRDLVARIVGQVSGGL